jgi:uncharacterized protein
MDTGTSRILAVLSHVSFFFLPIILPLVLLLLKNDDPFVRHHAKQAIVFHLAFYALMAISSFLAIILIGFLLMGIVGLWGLLFTIVATVRSLNDEYYRYPVTGSLID